VQIQSKLSTAQEEHLRAFADEAGEVIEEKKSGFWGRRK